MGKPSKIHYKSQNPNIFLGPHDRGQVPMSYDDHWVTTRITEVKKFHPLVTEAVLAQIVQLLEGQLSERQLTPAERKSVAGALIADMVPVPSNAEAQN